MPSPFPGMDPYLEQFWGDVHASLIIYARDQLQRRLPKGLRARVEERVFVEPGEGYGHAVYPDIRVIERGRRSADSAKVERSAEAGIAIAEPLHIRLPDEKVTQRYIEIVDVGSGRRVITVIEVLSLANKVSGEGQQLYLRKQREMIEGQVSLVEIDLLRAGQYVLSVPQYSIPSSDRTPYWVCVRRGWQPSDAEIYRVSLRQRLPIIGIPLRKTDADVPLDLQALLDQCYRNSAYDDIDYAKEPDPPLGGEDAAWADGLLREQGRRAKAPALRRPARQKRKNKR